MNPKIGAILIARHSGYIIGLKCSKGRGIVCPGGKWEKGETFKQTAIREFQEETGLLIDDKTVAPVFQAMSEEGYFTYVFVGQVAEHLTPVTHAIGHDVGSGPVCLTDYDALKQSMFGGFYEVCEAYQI